MKKLLILLAFIPCVLLAQPETVNVGATPNDGTGDPLRDAMIKLNTNDGAAFDSITDLRLSITDNTDSLFWTRSGTNLLPKTSGDHILLPGSGQAVKFRDGTSKITCETPGRNFFFYVDDTEQLSISNANTVLYGNLEPESSSTLDIGRDVSLWWRNLYVDQIYLDDAANKIDISGTDMTFTSAAAGTKTLDELAGNKEVSYTTCPDNDTTYISLDSDGVTFRIHYVAERNMIAGPRKQSGTVDVLYDDDTDITYYSSDYIGVDIDFKIEASDVAGALRLDIIVGSVNTDDLSFAYNVISKMYE